MRDEGRHIYPGIAGQYAIGKGLGEPRQESNTVKTNLFASTPIAGSGDPLATGSFRIGARVHGVKFGDNDKPCRGK